MVDLHRIALTPVDEMIAATEADGRVLVVDKTLLSGGQVEGIIAASVECQVGAIFSRAANSFTPLGVAANLVLISEDENVAAASGSVQ